MPRCLTVLATALGALLLAATPARAQVVELSYDDGVPTGSVQLGPGDLEVVRFTAEHPATLRTLRLYFRLAAGDTTVVVWGDNGGNAADVNDVLWSGVTTPVADDWTEIDVSAAGIELGALENFYVGQIVSDASTLLGWDGTGSDEHRSLIRRDGEWYYVGAADDPNLSADALVRAVVEYHDVMETHWFTDTTDSAGLADVGLSRMAWGDYDNDGDPDLLVNGNRLFANQGDGTFTEVTEAAGISGPTNGGVWGDYDNDGHLDFYATVHNYLPTCSVPADCVADGYTCTAGRCAPEGSTDPPAHDLLWHNNGDGTFTEVSEQAGHVYDFYPTEGAGWGDMDGDGDLDLYVANYETPTAWTGGALSVATPDILWENNGDGTFTDVSLEAGIYTFGDQCGRGVNWADYDEDGWQDIYVSNYRLNFNFLWRNEGYGRFEMVAGSAGVGGVQIQGAYGHTIGSQWGDFDNDGHLDLFTANLAHPRFIEFSDKSMLYLSSGPPDFTFTDIREAAGIAYYETHSDTALGDFDNDGLLDLFVTGVYVGYRSFLYQNNGDLTFTDQTYNAGAFVDNGWGAAWADIDGDGDLDLISRRLYRNDLTDTGHFMKVRLVGVVSNRSAIGAKVTVRAGGQTLVRQVEGGKGTTTQNDLTLHFGLGAATVADEVRIDWPSWPPWSDTYRDVTVGRTVTYIEGAGEQADGGVTADASVAADAGTSPDDGGAGCGCRTDARRGPAVPVLGLLLGLWLAARRRRTRRRRAALPAVLLLAAIAALTACGGGGGGDTPDAALPDGEVADASVVPDAFVEPPRCGTGSAPLPEGLIELGWDDGTPISNVEDAGWQIDYEGTLHVFGQEPLYEGVRFELAHPARIHGFAVRWAKLPEAGDPEQELVAGLYPDFGHNGFDFWVPDPHWLGSRCVKDASEGAWLTYVFDEPVELAQPGLVYVGHRREGAGEPAFAIDGTTRTGSCDAWDDCHSAMNLPDVLPFYNGLSIQLQYDYLVRLYVEYTDDLAPQERIFQEVDGLSLGNRVAWGDYDNDGWDDLLTSGPHLYRNTGDGTFVEVTASAGLSGLPGSGGVWGDYDNDGCLDLFLFSESYAAADTLLRSDCSGGFTDVTAAAGIVDLQGYNDCGDASNVRSPSPAAAWLDLDADGYLDLYVANFICWSDYTFYTDTVFRNNGDGTFTDVTATLGFSSAQTPSRGANPIDHDRDGDVDLLVNNYTLIRNLFFSNNGDGTVTEMAETLGLGGHRDFGGGWYYGHTIGTAWGDLDNDGDFDSVQANLAHPRFYNFSDKTQVLLNDGTGSYTDITGDWLYPASAAGLRYQETHSIPVLGDFDQDGALDLVITAVYPGRPTDFYWGNGDGTFTLDVYSTGITTVNGWGAAASDYDHDGDLDLATYRLFTNTMTTGKGHWLQVRVVGNAGSNWAAIGTTVALTAGGTDYLRYVNGGTGQGCQDSLYLHFGIGSATSVDQITAVFPGGGTVTYPGPFAVDRRVWLFEDGTTHEGWSPP